MREMSSSWFDRCMEAKRKRERVRNKWRINKRLDLWEEYKNARYDYIRLCREANRNNEDIVEKCKNHPKLSHQFANSKLRNKEGITKLEVNELKYRKP